MLYCHDANPTNLVLNSTSDMQTIISANLQVWFGEGFRLTAVTKCKSGNLHADSVCPAFVFGPSRPHADISPALPRQPVVFYDETRWDLERDPRRGGEKDGFFLLWHLSGGTATSDFHFRVKTQGSLTYGHDNKHCFTARDALCLSILLHRMMILSPPVWLMCLVVWLWIVASVCLSISFIANQFVFQLVPVLFCTPVFMPVRSRRSTR